MHIKLIDACLSSLICIIKRYHKNKLKKYHETTKVMGMKFG